MSKALCTAPWSDVTGTRSCAVAANSIKPISTSRFRSTNTLRSLFASWSLLSGRKSSAVISNVCVNASISTAVE